MLEKPKCVEIYSVEGDAMPIRGKRFMRQILRISPSADKTIRGNPRHYYFLLECGHTSYEYHGPYTLVRCFLLQTNPDAKLMKHCDDCARGRPPSPKCPKTNLPLGIVPIRYCREHCNEEQRIICHKAYAQWKAK